MAKQPSGKEKDDDSWGKLATDLLGIQFGTTDDDFDLPDDDIPAARLEAPPSTSEPATVSTSQHDVEPDLSFDDLQCAEPVKEVVSNEKAQDTLKSKAPVAGHPDAGGASEKVTSEPQEDIWASLESWNWDEPAKEAPRPRSDSAQERGRERPSGRGSARRERDDRSNRSKSRDASSVSTTEPKRSERPERPPQHERTSGRNPKVSAPSSVRDADPKSSSVDDVDDFSIGIDEVAHARSGGVQPTKPLSNPTSSAPRKSDRIEPRDEFDDFAGDLFVESDEDLVTESDAEIADTGNTTGESTEEDRSRRRRRRRRRGGRGRRPGAADGNAGTVEDDAPNLFDPEPDSDDDSTESSESTSSVKPVSEATEREGDRRPRRRRRSRRRPEERSEAGDIGSVSDQRDDDHHESESSSVLDSDSETVVPNVEVHVAPVDYAEIPTWEEAISYLVRTRGPDFRGRGDSGSRGRGGSQQRR